VAARVIPLHRALKRMPEPGSLLSLEEVRARMETPPADPVAWRVFTLVPRRQVTVFAQRWFDARLLGALKLGLVPEQCTCVRANEARIDELHETELSGSGAA